MCALLRMFSAMAGLPFEAVELLLLWAKNAAGTRFGNDVLVIEDTQDVFEIKGCKTPGGRKKYRINTTDKPHPTIHLRTRCPMSFDILLFTIHNPHAFKMYFHVSQELLAKT
jgi:hypothetical protein